MSQRALAAAVGMSRTQLTDYESGRNSPTVRTLDRLLAGCGLQARVTLEPLLADLDARVAELTAAPVRPAAPGDHREGDPGEGAGEGAEWTVETPAERLATLVQQLERISASMADGEGTQRLLPGAPLMRKGPVSWACDGALALWLHGFNAPIDEPEIVVVLDEAARYWFRAVMLRVFTVRGGCWSTWLDGEPDELREVLSGALGHTVVGALRIRAVEALPATLDVVPPGGRLALPTVPVDEVEQSHPTYREVLARWRQCRAEGAADVA